MCRFWKNILLYDIPTESFEENLKILYKKLFENAGFIDVKVHIKEDDNWICIEGHK